MYARDKFMDEVADLIAENWRLQFDAIDVEDNVIVAELPNGETYEITVVEVPF